MVKTPVAVLLLLGIATFNALHFTSRYGANSLVPIVMPALLLLLIISSQTGFSRHYRYALPILPIVFIWASMSLWGNTTKTFLGKLCVGLLLVWATLSSLTIQPHSMSYFNWIVGGAGNGHAILLDSNIDWGQDLANLKRWYDRNPNCRPLKVAYFGDFHIPPKVIGIDCENMLDCKDTLQSTEDCWYAVSVNHLREYRHSSVNPRRLGCFLSMKPIAKAGHSIYIYHIPRHVGGKKGSTTNDVPPV